MRMFIIRWVAPFAVLIGGGFLAAMAHGAKEPPRDQFNAAPSIDSRELTEKAGPLPPQAFDAI